MTTTTTSRFAVAGEALVAYWRGAPALAMRERDHCRRLEELLGPRTREALVRAARDDEPGCAERAASALRSAARAEPVVHDLVAKLAPAPAEPERSAAAGPGLAPPVNVNGNGNAVLNVGGSIIGSNVQVGNHGQPAAAASAEEKAPPLRVLFAAAEPSDLARLRLGTEAREVREALALSTLKDRVLVDLWTAVRPRDFVRAVMATRPWVIHFSGHGAGTGELCFEGDAGQAQRVPPDGLESFFEVVGEGVRCVVLNACYAEIQARAIAKHVPWVVGMKQQIGDKAAIAFAIGFYQALGEGKDFPEAFKVGCSMIRMEGFTEHLVPVLISSHNI